MNGHTGKRYILSVNNRRAEAQKTKDSLSWGWIAVIVVGIFGMLCPIYEVIGPLYASMYQFKMNYIGTTSILAVLPYLVLISIFLYRQQKRATLSDYFIIILTLCYFLPGTIMYVYGNWSNSYYVYHLLSYLCLVITNELLPSFTTTHSLNIRRNSKSAVPFFSIVIPLSVILITLYYNGLRINLQLGEVYDMRREWSSSRMPNIFNYYLPFAARITPILLLITLKQRRIWLSSLLIFSQLVSFSFGGLKYTLFALVLGILFHFFGQTINAKKVIIYFSIFVVLCYGECLLVSDQLPMLTIYTLRRMSFIPNQIGYYFFAFTQGHDYLYYSESFLRGLLHYPYSYPFPHVIGEYAFGLPDMGANTGLFAEGFSQIGWLSLPIYSVLYVISFRIYEACTRGFQKTDMAYVPLLGLLLYAFTLQDGAFFSVLLTQGFALSVLVLYLLSHTQMDQSRHKRH